MFEGFQKFRIKSMKTKFSREQLFWRFREMRVEVDLSEAKKQELWNSVCEGFVFLRTRLATSGWVADIFSKDFNLLFLREQVESGVVKLSAFEYGFLLLLSTDSYSPQNGGLGSSIGYRHGFEPDLRFFEGETDESNKARIDAETVYLIELWREVARYYWQVTVAPLEHSLAWASPLIRLKK